VEAIDISATAVATARKHCENLKNVNIRCASLAEHIPQSFDLFVFAEVGYYFAYEKLCGVLAECVANLSPDGTLLGCHWLGSSKDHILSGDVVHEAVAALPGLHLELSERHTNFRLDRWKKTVEVVQ
jgi:SAM-dependent methyltransferase